MSVRLSLCVCVFSCSVLPMTDVQRYLLPTGHCLVCKSGARPLGRSREGTKPCQADLSTSRASSGPLSTLCSRGGLGRGGGDKSAGPSMRPGAFLATDSLLTSQRPSSELKSHSSETSSHLLPSTARKAFSLGKEKYMKRTGWK